MKIKKITSRSRRDFYAIYQCEHCNHEHESSGYDDTYFHQNVIPNMVCKKCNKKVHDSYRPLQPKYPANQIV